MSGNSDSNGGEGASCSSRSSLSKRQSSSTSLAGTNQRPKRRCRQQQQDEEGLHQGANRRRSKRQMMILRDCGGGGRGTETQSLMPEDGLNEDTSSMDTDEETSDCHDKNDAIASSTSVSPNGASVKSNKFSPDSDTEMAASAVASSSQNKLLCHSTSDRSKCGTTSAKQFKRLSAQDTGASTNNNLEKGLPLHSNKMTASMENSTDQPTRSSRCRNSQNASQRSKKAVKKNVRSAFKSRHGSSSSSTSRNSSSCSPGGSRCSKPRLRNCQEVSLLNICTKTRRANSTNITTNVITTVDVPKGKNGRKNINKSNTLISSIKPNAHQVVPRKNTRRAANDKVDGLHKSSVKKEASVQGVSVSCHSEDSNISTVVVKLECPQNGSAEVSGNCSEHLPVKSEPVEEGVSTEQGNGLQQNDLPEESTSAWTKDTCSSSSAIGKVSDALNCFSVQSNAPTSTEATVSTSHFNNTRTVYCTIGNISPGTVDNIVNNNHISKGISCTTAATTFTTVYHLPLMSNCLASLPPSSETCATLTTNSNINSRVSLMPPFSNTDALPVPPTTIIPAVVASSPQAICHSYISPAIARSFGANLESAPDLFSLCGLSPPYVSPPPCTTFSPSLTCSTDVPQNALLANSMFVQDATHDKQRGGVSTSHSLSVARTKSPSNECTRLGDHQPVATSSAPVSCCFPSPVRGARFVFPSTAPLGQPITEQHHRPSLPTSAPQQLSSSHTGGVFLPGSPVAPSNLHTYGSTSATSTVLQSALAHSSAVSPTRSSILLSTAVASTQSSILSTAATIQSSSTPLGLCCNVTKTVSQELSLCPVTSFKSPIVSAVTSTTTGTEACASKLLLPKHLYSVSNVSTPISTEVNSISSSSKGTFSVSTVTSTQPLLKSVVKSIVPTPLPRLKSSVNTSLLSVTRHSCTPSSSTSTCVSDLSAVGVGALSPSSRTTGILSSRYGLPYRIHGDSDQLQRSLNKSSSPKVVTTSANAVVVSSLNCTLSTSTGQQTTAANSMQHVDSRSEPINKEILDCHPKTLMVTAPTVTPAVITTSTTSCQLRKPSLKNLSPSEVYGNLNPFLAKSQSTSEGIQQNVFNPRTAETIPLSSPTVEGGTDIKKHKKAKVCKATLDVEGQATCAKENDASPITASSHHQRQEEHPKTNIPISLINEHFVCKICWGYFVNATTIVVCQHTFCRSCIVPYLDGSTFCPVCEVQLHKTSPMSKLRADTALQTLLYTVLPHLYHDEVLQRERFGEQVKGKPLPVNWPPDRPLLPTVAVSPLPPLGLQDLVCFQLIPCLDDTVQPLTGPRFYQCSASLSISMVKRLLRLKYNLSRSQPLLLMVPDFTRVRKQQSKCQSLAETKSDGIATSTGKGSAVVVSTDNKCWEPPDKLAEVDTHRISLSNAPLPGRFTSIDPKSSESGIGATCSTSLCNSQNIACSVNSSAVQQLDDANSEAGRAGHQTEIQTEDGQSGALRKDVHDEILKTVSHSECMVAPSVDQRTDSKQDIVGGGDLYPGLLLLDTETLRDAAYIVGWKRNKPLRMFYKIHRNHRRKYSGASGRNTAHLLSIPSHVVKEYEEEPLECFVDELAAEERLANAACVTTTTPLEDTSVGICSTSVFREVKEFSANLPHQTIIGAEVTKGNEVSQQTPLMTSVTSSLGLYSLATVTSSNGQEQKDPSAEKDQEMPLLEPYGTGPSNTPDGTDSASNPSRTSVAVHDTAPLLQAEGLQKWRHVQQEQLQKQTNLLHHLQKPSLAAATPVVVESEKPSPAAMRPEQDIKTEYVIKSQKVTKPKSASTPRTVKTSASGSRGRPAKKQVQVPTKTFTSVSASKNSAESIYASSLNGVALRSAASSTSTTALLDTSSNSSIVVSALSHQQLLLLQDQQQLAQIQQLSQIQHMYSIQQQQHHHSSSTFSSSLGDSPSPMDISAAAALSTAQPFPDLSLSSLASTKGFPGPSSDGPMLDASGASGMQNTQFGITGFNAGGAGLVYAAGNNVANINALAGNAQGINLGALAPSFNLGYSILPFVSTCNPLDNTSTALAGLNTSAGVSTLDASGSLAGAASSLVTSDSLTRFTNTGSVSTHDMNNGLSNSGLSLQGTLIPSFGSFSFAPGLFCLGQPNAATLSATTAQSAAESVSSQHQHVQSALVVSNSSDEACSAVTNNALQAYASLFAASTSFSNTAAMFGIEAALNMSGLTAVMVPPPTHSPALVTNVSGGDDVSASISVMGGSDAGSSINSTATTCTDTASLPSGVSSVGPVHSPSPLIEGLAKISDVGCLAPQSVLADYSAASNSLNSGNPELSFVKKNVEENDNASSLGACSTVASVPNVRISVGDGGLYTTSHQQLASSVALSGDAGGERVMLTTSYAPDVSDPKTPMTVTSSSDTSSEWKEVQLKISECGVMSVSSGGQDDYMEGLLNQMESETTSQLLSTVESASAEHDTTTVVQPLSKRALANGINNAATVSSDSGSADTVAAASPSVNFSDAIATVPALSVSAETQSQSTGYPLPTVPSESVSSKSSQQLADNGPALPTSSVPTQHPSASGFGTEMVCTPTQAQNLAGRHSTTEKESVNVPTRVSKAAPSGDCTVLSRAEAIASVPISKQSVPSQSVISPSAASFVRSSSAVSLSVSSSVVLPPVALPPDTAKHCSKKDQSPYTTSTSTGLPIAMSKSIASLKSKIVVKSNKSSVPVDEEGISPKSKSGVNPHQMNSALSSGKVVTNNHIPKSVTFQTVAKSKGSPVGQNVPTVPQKAAWESSPLLVDPTHKPRSSGVNSSAIPPSLASVDSVSGTAFQTRSKVESSSSTPVDKRASSDRATCKASSNKVSEIDVAKSLLTCSVDSKSIKSVKRKSSELSSDLQQSQVPSQENKKPLKDFKRKPDVLHSEEDRGGSKRLKIDTSEIVTPYKTLTLGSSLPKLVNSGEERPVMNRKTSKLKEIAEKQKLVTGKSPSNGSFLSQVDSLDNSSKTDLSKLSASIGFNSHIPTNLAATTLANLKNLNKLSSTPSFGMLPMKLDGGSKGDVGAGNSKSPSGRKSQSIGYKTLNTSPKGWNPTISREHIQMGVAASGGGSTPKTNKFFKARNAPKIFSPLSAFKTTSSPLVGVENNTNKKEASAPSSSSSVGNKTSSSVGVNSTSAAMSVKEKSGSSSPSAVSASSSTSSKESQNSKLGVSGGKSSPRTSRVSASASSSSLVKGSASVSRPTVTSDATSPLIVSSSPQPAQVATRLSATTVMTSAPVSVADLVPGDSPSLMSTCYRTPLQASVTDATTSIAIACRLDSVDKLNKSSSKVTADCIEPSVSDTPVITKYGINTTVLESNCYPDGTPKSAVAGAPSSTAVTAVPITTTPSSSLAAGVSDACGTSPVIDALPAVSDPAPTTSSDGPVLRGKKGTVSATKSPCSTVGIVDSRPSAVKDREAGSMSSSLLSRGALESAVSCAPLPDCVTSASSSSTQPMDNNNRSSALVSNNINNDKISPDNVCIVNDNRTTPCAVSTVDVNSNKTILCAVSAVGSNKTNPLLVNVKKSDNKEVFSPSVAAHLEARNNFIPSPVVAKTSSSFVAGSDLIHGVTSHVSALSVPTPPLNTVLSVPQYPRTVEVDTQGNTQTRSKTSLYTASSCQSSVPQTILSASSISTDESVSSVIGKELLDVVDSKTDSDIIVSDGNDGLARSVPRSTRAVDVKSLKSKCQTKSDNLMGPIVSTNPQTVASTTTASSSSNSSCLTAKRSTNSKSLLSPPTHLLVPSIPLVSQWSGSGRNSQQYGLHGPLVHPSRDVATSSVTSASESLVSSNLVMTSNSVDSGPTLSSVTSRISSSLLTSNDPVNKSLLKTNSSFSQGIPPIGKQATVNRVSSSKGGTAKVNGSPSVSSANLPLASNEVEAAVPVSSVFGNEVLGTSSGKTCSSVSSAKGSSDCISAEPAAVSKVDNSSGSKLTYQELKEGQVKNAPATVPSMALVGLTPAASPTSIATFATCVATTSPAKASTLQVAVTAAGSFSATSHCQSYPTPSSSYNTSIDYQSGSHTASSLSAHAASQVSTHNTEMLTHTSAAMPSQTTSGVSSAQATFGLSGHATSSAAAQVTNTTITAKTSSAANIHSYSSSNAAVDGTNPFSHFNANHYMSYPFLYHHGGLMSPHGSSTGYSYSGSPCSTPYPYSNNSVTTSTTTPNNNVSGYNTSGAINNNVSAASGFGVSSVYNSIGGGGSNACASSGHYSGVPPLQGSQQQHQVLVTPTATSVAGADNVSGHSSNSGSPHAAAASAQYASAPQSPQIASSPHASHSPKLPTSPLTQSPKQSPGNVSASNKSSPYSQNSYTYAPYQTLSSGAVGGNASLQTASYPCQVSMASQSPTTTYSSHIMAAHGMYSSLLGSTPPSSLVSSQATAYQSPVSSVAVSHSGAHGYIGASAPKQTTSSSTAVAPSLSSPVKASPPHSCSPKMQAAQSSANVFFPHQQYQTPSPNVSPLALNSFNASSLEGTTSTSTPSTKQVFSSGHLSSGKVSSKTEQVSRASSKYVSGHQISISTSKSSQSHDCSRSALSSSSTSTKDATKSKSNKLNGSTSKANTKASSSCKSNNNGTTGIHSSMESSQMFQNYPMFNSSPYALSNFMSQNALQQGSNILDPFSAYGFSRNLQACGGSSSGSQGSSNGNYSNFQGASGRGLATPDMASGYGSPSYASAAAGGAGGSSHASSKSIVDSRSAAAAAAAAAQYHHYNSSGYFNASASAMAGQQDSSSSSSSSSAVNAQAAALNAYLSNINHSSFNSSYAMAANFSSYFMPNSFPSMMQSGWNTFPLTTKPSAVAGMSHSAIDNSSYSSPLAAGNSSVNSYPGFYYNQNMGGYSAGSLMSNTPSYNSYPYFSMHPFNPALSAAAAATTTTAVTRATTTGSSVSHTSDNLSSSYTSSSVDKVVHCGKQTQKPATSAVNKFTSSASSGAGNTPYSIPGTFGHHSSKNASSASQSVPASANSSGWSDPSCLVPSSTQTAISTTKNSSTLQHSSPAKSFTTPTLTPSIVVSSQSPIKISCVSTESSSSCTTSASVSFHSHASLSSSCFSNETSSTASVYYQPPLASTSLSGRSAPDAAAANILSSLSQMVVSSAAVSSKPSRATPVTSSSSETFTGTQTATTTASTTISPSSKTSLLATPGVAVSQSVSASTQGVSITPINTVSTLGDVSTESLRSLLHPSASPIAVVTSTTSSGPAAIRPSVPSGGGLSSLSVSFGQEMQSTSNRTITTSSITSSCPSNDTDGLSIKTCTKIDVNNVKTSSKSSNLVNQATHSTISQFSSDSITTTKSSGTGITAAAPLMVTNKSNTKRSFEVPISEADGQPMTKKFCSRITVDSKEGSLTAVVSGTADGVSARLDDKSKESTVRTSTTASPACAPVMQPIAPSQRSNVPAITCTSGSSSSIFSCTSQKITQKLSTYSRSSCKATPVSSVATSNVQQASVVQSSTSSSDVSDKISSKTISSPVSNTDKTVTVALSSPSKLDARTKVPRKGISDPVVNPLPKPTTCSVQLPSMKCVAASSLGPKTEDSKSSQAKEISKTPTGGKSKPLVPKLVRPSLSSAVLKPAPPTSRHTVPATAVAARPTPSTFGASKLGQSPPKSTVPAKVVTSSKTVTTTSLSGCTPVSSTSSLAKTVSSSSTVLSSSSKSSVSSSSSLSKQIVASLQYSIRNSACNKSPISSKHPTSTTSPSLSRGVSDTAPSVSGKGSSISMLNKVTPSVEIPRTTVPAATTTPASAATGIQPVSSVPQTHSLASGSIIRPKSTASSFPKQPEETPSVRSAKTVSKSEEKVTSKQPISNAIPLSPGPPSVSSAAVVAAAAPSIKPSKSEPNKSSKTKQSSCSIKPSPDHTQPDSLPTTKPVTKTTNSPPTATAGAASSPTMSTSSAAGVMILSPTDSKPLTVSVTIESRAATATPSLSSSPSSSSTSSPLDASSASATSATGTSVTPKPVAKTSK